MNERGWYLRRETGGFKSVQEYKMQLITEAEKINQNNISRRNFVLNSIQQHAINQVKEGYTSFRITHLSKEDEVFLKEWADMSAADVKIIKFKCYENTKKYMIRQFNVDLSNVINVKYKKQGNTLIME